MVSRRKILSRSRDGLNSDFQDDENDVWFQKDNFFQDHIQEVFNKWKQIEDEIWAKIIVMERNRRVAKAYARAPVLTINGSDDGFDGYRIGLCGFDNPMRDAKTEEVKRNIGHGVKIKMDDGGNIMIKRLSRSNVYVKEGNTISNDTTTGGVLEMEKPIKIFDMKKFADSVATELNNAYPDRRKLESQCISAISFVKNCPGILDCPCWVMIINIVALDMLRSKMPLVSKLSRVRQVGRSQSVGEEPFSVSSKHFESSIRNSLLNPKPPPRDNARTLVPVPDYDWKHDGRKQKMPQQPGSKDDPYYCGMRARVPNFGTKRQSLDRVAPVYKSHSSGYLGLLRHDASSESKRINADDEFTSLYNGIRSASSHTQMSVGEWE